MEDVRLSLDALTRAVQAVNETADRDRVLGRILCVARLLKTDAVIANAITDLEHDELAADSAKIEQGAKEILGRVETVFFELADLYACHGSSWQRIVDAHPDLLARVTTNETLPGVLRRVRSVSSRGRAGLAHADLEPFTTTVSPVLRTAIDAAKDPKTLTQVSQYLDQLDALTEQSRRLVRFRALCATGSVAGVVARVRSLLAEWDARIAGGPSSDNWIVPNSNGLEHDLPLVASRIEGYLSGRRSRRIVLFRAKVYFEHFFRREARELLEREEARVAKERADGGNPKAQRELVLRRPLDRFIFQEGFFPITEASAGGGNLDMLIADADAAGIRPLVAEIKQAARIQPDDVRLDDVANAIDAARKEVPSYAGHLRARRGWEDVEPLVVVFHTSIDDVSRLEDASTILVNIGTRTPSQLRSGGK